MRRALLPLAALALGACHLLLHPDDLPPVPDAGAGGACSDGREACGGVCCPDTQSCNAGQCCMSDGEICEVGTPCCGSCVNPGSGIGVCQGGGACSGTPCDQGVCCRRGEQCVSGMCCADPGEPCVSGYVECCSGPGACASASGGIGQCPQVLCAPLQASCQNDQECCSNHCTLSRCL